MSGAFDIDPHLQAACTAAGLGVQLDPPGLRVLFMYKREGYREMVVPKMSFSFAADAPPLDAVVEIVEHPPVSRWVKIKFSDVRDLLYVPRELWVLLPTIDIEDVRARRAKRFVELVRTALEDGEETKLKEAVALASWVRTALDNILAKIA